MHTTDAIVWIYRGRSPAITTDEESYATASLEKYRTQWSYAALATWSQACYRTSDAVNSVSGWRFELVVTNPKKTAVVGELGEELSVEELRSRLSAVRQLMSIQQKEAATLLAWAMTEASMRLLAEQQGIELKGNSPVFVMKTLFSLGVLSRDDYELLQEAMQFRNSLAHGYRPVEPEQDYASKLVNKVEEFLQGITE